MDLTKIIAKNIKKGYSVSDIEFILKLDEGVISSAVENGVNLSDDIMENITNWDLGTEKQTPKQIKNYREEDKVKKNSSTALFWGFGDSHAVTKQNYKSNNTTVADIFWEGMETKGFTFDFYNAPRLDLEKYTKYKKEDCPKEEEKRKIWLTEKANSDRQIRMVWMKHLENKS